MANEIDAYSRYDPERDHINSIDSSDTRKPVLTLKHLNLLKKMRAAKDLETLKRKDLLQVMYGNAEESGGGGGLGF